MQEGDSHKRNEDQSAILRLKNIIPVFEQSFCRGLDESGQGAYLFLAPKPTQSQWNELIAPHFFQFSLNIEKDVLKERMKDYLSRYGKEKLDSNKSYFGLSFMERLFKSFFKTMLFRQGRKMIIKLGRPKTDEFLQVFARKYQAEFLLWNEGIYSIPYWTHLLYLQHLGKLSLKSISVSVHEKLDSHKILGLNMVDLSVQIKISLSPKKPLKSYSNVDEDILHTIELTEADGQQFFAYLNHNYDRPILFSRNHKSGDLLYTLASDGYADFNWYNRVFEYLRTDKRFKLFAQSKFPHQSIVMRDKEGYIVPADGLSISFLQPNS